ncbi:MAG: DnaB-like helicase C-terminal domain-containing protein [Floccifex sp.]
MNKQETKLKVKVKLGKKIIHSSGYEEAIMDGEKAFRLVSKPQLPLNEGLKQTIVGGARESFLAKLAELEDVDEKTSDERIGIQDIHRKLHIPLFNPRISPKFDQRFFPKGFVKGEMYGITAPTGGGKSSFAVFLATSQITGFNPNFHDTVPGRKIIYITLEMPKEFIRSRIVSTLSAFNDIDHAVPYVEIITKSIEDENCFRNYMVAEKTYDLFQNNLKILDSSDFPSLTPQDVTVGIENAMKLFDPDLVILDQIVNIAAEDPSNDTKSPLLLRQLAGKTDKNILVVTQMSKEEMKKSYNGNCFDVSKLSSASLRGSSNLEQQCSDILILSKDKEKTERFGRSINKMAVKSVKGRYGSEDTFMLGFDGCSGFFFDLEEDDDSGESMGMGVV